MKTFNELTSRSSSKAVVDEIACVAWRFWLGALSNKGGRGQRNREEIGAEATWTSPLRRSFSPASRANFAAAPLLRPARQNRHATQAIDEMESDNGLNSKDHKQVKQKCEIPFFYGIELNLRRYVIEVDKFFVEFVIGTDKY